MARPRKKIDPEQVKALAGIGCTNEEMADALKCSPDTLTRRFADAIESGRATAKRSLRRMQWESAKNGSTGMLIWLGKQMLGQRDKQEISGPDGGPIQHEHFDLSKLSNEQLAELERLVETAYSGAGAGGDTKA